MDTVRNVFTRKSSVRYIGTKILYCVLSENKLCVVRVVDCVYWRQCQYAVMCGACCRQLTVSIGGGVSSYV